MTYVKIASRVVALAGLVAAVCSASEPTSSVPEHFGAGDKDASLAPPPSQSHFLPVSSSEIFFENLRGSRIRWTSCCRQRTEAKVVSDNGAHSLAICCTNFTPEWSPNFQQLINGDGAHDVVDDGIIHAKELVHSSFDGTFIFPMPKGRILQLWDALMPSNDEDMALFQDLSIRRSIIKQLFALYKKFDHRDPPVRFLRFDPRNFALVVNGKEVQVIYLLEAALLATTLENAPTIATVDHTPLYTAPELIRNSGVSQQGIDTYALAMIILGYMTENRLLDWLGKKYNKKEVPQMRAILNGEFFTKVKAEKPELAQFFDPNPFNRPSFEDLVQVVTAIDPSLAETE